MMKIYTMNTRRKGSLIFQVNNIIKKYNGIGKSKLEFREESNLKSENNHKISPFFHSYKSLDNVRANLTNLAKFAKKNHNIKDISKIDIFIIKNWINSKNITYRTASNYFSELNKISDCFEYTKEEIKEFRNELKKSDISRTGLLAEQTRSYNNLQSIILENEKSDIVFQLQRDFGLRVKAASHINISKQIKHTESKIEYSEKGGKLSEKILSISLIYKIIKYSVNNIFSVNKRTYSRHLQKAIEKTGQKFNGTHGIRHSYAQKKMKEGFTKAQVSNELGHTRENIIDVYLR